MSEWGGRVTRPAYAEPMSTSTTAEAAPGTGGRPILCQDRPTSADSTRDACRGVVDFREPLSGTGAPTIRCDHHWNARLELQDRLRRDYPDSDTPPHWYTEQGGEAYAGERWNDDY